MVCPLEATVKSTPDLLSPVSKLLPPKVLAAVTAQLTHLLVGVVVVMGANLFFPGNGIALVVAVISLLIIVSLKETLFDPAEEVNAHFFWNGVTDLSFYIIGIAVGFGLVYLSTHVW
jgi:hypothetical protein